MAAPRLKSIRRELRECSKHGRAEHSQYYSGTESIEWVCTVCKKEQNADYYNRKKNGGEVRSYTRQRVDTATICPGCNTALPKTGVCDNCD